MKDKKDGEEEFNAMIAKKLQHYRMLHNANSEKGERITQEKLAELADVSLGLISGFEAQSRPSGISIYSFKKICKALNVSSDDILGL